MPDDLYRRFARNGLDLAVKLRPGHAELGTDVIDGYIGIVKMAFHDIAELQYEPAVLVLALGGILCIGIACH